MKEIPLSEDIAVEDGQPPLEDDDFMSDLIESNAEFRAELVRRHSGKFVTVDEALQRLMD